MNIPMSFASGREISRQILLALLVDSLAQLLVLFFYTRDQFSSPLRFFLSSVKQGKNKFSFPTREEKNHINQARTFCL